MSSTRQHITIVPTGSANLASVVAAFERLGCTCAVTVDPAAVVASSHLVLPGVGAFGAAVSELTALGLLDPIRQRVRRAADQRERGAGHYRPVLAICLGLQLLFDQSEESPGVLGLGIERGHVTKLAQAAAGRVPFFGWSRVLPPAGTPSLLEPGDAYFAHSYRVRVADVAHLAPSESEPRRNISTAAHDGSPGGFAAAIERGDLLACQFHPELSGPWGTALLARWLNGQRNILSVATRGAASGTIASPTRVIPCLDIRDGRVVKGVQFQNLRDAGDPVAQAQAYEAQGADELVMLDVSATAEGRRASLDTVARVRQAIAIPLAVGGGVRSVEDAAAMLNAGADKVGVNTAAVTAPELITSLADRFGSQCVVVAIDAKRNMNTEPGWTVMTRAGKHATQLDAVDWAVQARHRGAGEILLTSVDRDGTGDGYDYELLRSVSRAVSLPVIASGGAANPDHLREAINAGADAVLAASIFHDGVFTVESVKRELAREGVCVRL